VGVASEAASVATMSAATYRIQVIHSDRHAWEEELRDAVVREVAALGLHRSVTVTVEPTAPSEEPSVVAFLGSAAGASDDECLTALDKALADGYTVLPIVSDLAVFLDEVPQSLRSVNGRINRPSYSTDSLNCSARDSVFFPS
jgi:hypothetical protein